MSDGGPSVDSDQIFKKPPTYLSTGLGLGQGVGDGWSVWRRHANPISYHLFQVNPFCLRAEQPCSPPTECPFPWQEMTDKLPPDKLKTFIQKR